MGFPVGYTGVFIPKVFIQTLSLLGYLQKLLTCLFSFFRLSDFLEPTNDTNEFFFPAETRSDLPFQYTSPPLSVVLIREFLPVMRLSDLVAGAGAVSAASQASSSATNHISHHDVGAERCAVCLYKLNERNIGGEETEEAEGKEQEVRLLVNCKHIFHKGCLDRWIDHDQRTCPLCRTMLIPDDKMDEFNQRLEEDAAVASSTITDLSSLYISDDDHNSHVDDDDDDDDQLDEFDRYYNSRSSDVFLFS